MYHQCFSFLVLCKLLNSCVPNLLILEEEYDSQHFLPFLKFPLSTFVMMPSFFHFYHLRRGKLLHDLQHSTKGSCLHPSTRGKSAYHIYQHKSISCTEKMVYVIQDLTNLWDFKASTRLESKVFSLERLCPSSLLVPSLLVYSPWSLVSSL